MQTASVLLEDRTRIPVAAGGLKVLGGAIAESAFCTAVFQKQVNRALEDLVRLKGVPHLHIRAKQAIYCVNGCLSYYMRLVLLSISEPQAKLFDEAMAGFFRQLLCFPGQEEYGEHGDLY